MAAWAPPQKPKYGQLPRHASTPDRYSAIQPDGDRAAVATICDSGVSQHRARGEVSVLGGLEAGELGREQHDSTVLADRGDRIVAPGQQLIGIPGQARAGVPQRPLHLPHLQPRLPAPGRRQLGPERPYRGTVVGVRPYIDALLFLDIDAQHGAAQFQEKLVQLFGMARSGIGHHAERGEGDPVPAQRLDASHDPVVRRRAATQDPPRGQVRRAVDAQPDPDVMGGEELAPGIVDQGRVGLDVVLHSGERGHQRAEVLAPRGQRLATVPHHREPRRGRGPADSPCRPPPGPPRPASGGLPPGKASNSTNSQDYTAWWAA